MTLFMTVISSINEKVTVALPFSQGYRQFQGMSCLGSNLIFSEICRPLIAQNAYERKRNGGVYVEGEEVREREILYTKQHQQLVYLL